MINKELVRLIEILEQIDCQFNSCNGDESKPITALTCIRCRELYNARQRLKIAKEKMLTAP